MVKYRDHRSGLAESMATERAVSCIDELMEHLRSTGYPDVTAEQLAFLPQGFDKRTGWNSHLVTVDRAPCGYSDGIPPKHPLPPAPYIEVMQYRGKNGGFARVHETLFLARIVGVNGRKVNCDQSSWHGHTIRHYADEAAETWAELLGCKIVQTVGDEQLGGNPPTESTVLEPKADSDISKAGADLGQKGGTARAKSLSAERRSEIARAAAQARWRK